MNMTRFGSRVFSHVSSIVSGMERELLGFERSPPQRLLGTTSWRPDGSCAYCRHCGEGLDRILPVCRSCRGLSWPSRGVIRLGPYAEPLSDWIRAVKFDRWHAMGTALGVELAHAVNAHPIGSTLEDPLVVPVPMPFGRKLSRGIDHAMTIARSVARTNGWQLVQPLQQRRGMTQASRTAAQRLRRTNPFERRRRVPSLSSRHVLLVDDVLTSGRTVHQVVRLLRRLGAETVTVAVVAATEADGMDRHGE